ncbi:MAG: VWA domain-containing protein [Verrucomicrobiota bacterium]
MQSTDETPSRFEKARTEALRLVDSMHESDQMVVLQASSSTEVKQSPTSEKAALKRAIHSCRATDTPTRLHDALKLAETLIQNHQRPEVHLFSDGAVGGLDQFENSGLPLSFHRVGKGGNNVGITTLDVRPNPENPIQRAVFSSIANYSTNTQNVSLELHFGEQLMEVKTLSLGAHETSPQVFVASQPRDLGVFSVRLTGQDDLAADNQASVVSVLPAPVKVLLVSAGNRFLEKALRAAALVELTVVNTLTTPALEYDLVVLDNVTPAAWPSGNVLAFHCAKPGWFGPSAKLDAPPIVALRSSHPVLRFVSLDNVQIAESLAVQTPSWGAALVDAPQNPLLVAGEIGRQRIVWVGFDVLQSTWPLRISFPIFIANAVDWLNPAAINASQLTVQAGKPLHLAVTQPVETARIQTPDGKVKEWKVNQITGELVFGDTLKQGTYRVTVGTNETIFCANLLDAAESDITPKDEIKLGKYAKATATTLKRASLEIWRWMAAAVLAVLMFEWWFYHRRTV